MSAIFVTLLYPSYGPFFLEWERFRWAAETMTGRTQAFLIGRFLESSELVAQGRKFVPVAFSGIAAFPRLHVGQMVLVAFVAWSTARPFALFMIGVSLVTTVSTLAFGWHYLIDAVAGAALALWVAASLRPWCFGRCLRLRRRPRAGGAPTR